LFSWSRSMRRRAAEKVLVTDLLTVLEADCVLVDPGVRDSTEEGVVEGDTKVAVSAGVLLTVEDVLREGERELVEDSVTDGRGELVLEGLVVVERDAATDMDMDGQLVFVPVPRSDRDMEMLEEALLQLEAALLADMLRERVRVTVVETEGHLEAEEDELSDFELVTVAEAREDEETDTERELEMVCVTQELTLGELVDERDRNELRDMLMELDRVSDALGEADVVPELDTERVMDTEEVVVVEKEREALLESGLDAVRERLIVRQLEEDALVERVLDTLGVEEGEALSVTEILGLDVCERLSELLAETVEEGLTEREEDSELQSEGDAVELEEGFMVRVLVDTADCVLLSGGEREVVDDKEVDCEPESVLDLREEAELEPETLGVDETDTLLDSEGVIDADADIVLDVEMVFVATDDCEGELVEDSVTETRGLAVLLCDLEKVVEMEFVDERVVVALLVDVCD
jgi:hypothetical protein